jgi:hypothetical protein
VEGAAYHFYRQLLQRGIAERHLAAGLNLQVETFVCVETSMKLRTSILAHADVTPEDWPGDIPVSMG